MFISLSFGNYLEASHLSNEFVIESDSLGKEVKSFEFGANLYTVSHSTVDELLSVIKKKYKRKTVIIDLWGTFCKPCLTDFKNSKTVKEELLEKNVHMVYLCAGKSSAPNKWVEVIERDKLKGDHIYLDNVMTTSYMQKFGIKRYPNYIIKDKKGKLHHNVINGVSNVDVELFLKQLKSL